MDAQVRTAEPDDVDAILAFGSTVIVQHYSPILGSDAAEAQLAWWGRERISRAVAAGRVQVVVDDRRIVGVAETGEIADEQVIWKLYLAPTHRGRSLGVELLERAIAGLPAGTDHVLVEHFAGNGRAGAFYEREGFEVVDTESDSSGNPSAAVVWRRRNLRG